jgi:hypothetical protein
MFDTIMAKTGRAHVFRVKPLMIFEVSNNNLLKWHFIYDFSLTEYLLPSKVVT